MFSMNLQTYLIHSERITAGADEGEEPEGERIRIRDEHLDEVQTAHQVHRKAAQDTRGLQFYTF